MRRSLWFAILTFTATIASAAEFDLWADTPTVLPMLAPPVPPERQVLYFSAGWCQVCKNNQKPLAALKEAGWRMGSEPDKTIRTLDYDADHDLSVKFRVTSVPTFVLVVNGEEVIRKSGVMDQWQIGKFYETKTPTKVTMVQNERVCQCKGYNERVCLCLKAGMACHCNASTGSIHYVNSQGWSLGKTGSYANPN